MAGSLFSFNTKDIVKIPGFEHLIIEKEMYINTVSSINKPSNCSLIFLKKITDEALEKINTVSGCMLLLPSGTDFEEDITKHNLLIPSENPRMDFAIILSYLLTANPVVKPYKALENGIVIGSDVNIGKNTTIEPQVFIDHNVTIGDYCTIKSGCKIRSNVTIGNYSVLYDNSVIGKPGFGVERDEINGTNISLPHVGGVIIGDHSEIGATSNIASGTIDPTELGDYVKIDDRVHIAHNCKIKREVLISAGAVICGSVVIGERSWIGPNSTITDNKSIGSNASVALGSVVLRNVMDNEIVSGNPARRINEISNG